MLCAQNCLNNLLQNPMFTPQDLSDIARSLDELEASHLDPTAHNNPSENYDDTGFFSIMGKKVFSFHCCFLISYFLFQFFF